MAWVRGLVVFVVLPMTLMAVGGVVASYWIIETSKSLAGDGNWFETPSGIDESGFVTLNGVEHYYRIRGRDANNPIIVDLHGGPGGASSGYSHRALRPLTEFFTLVEWDQRGAGRSATGDPSDATYEQMVADAVAMIEFTLVTLDADKVILVGHSWGSMLGLGVAKKRPDLLHAYVGVGQGLAWQATFEETRRLVTKAANASGDVNLLKTLAAIPDAWPAKSDPVAVLKKIARIQAPLADTGNAIHASHSGDYMQTGLLLDTITSPDLTLLQAYDMLSPTETTLALVQDLYERDFRREFGHEFDIPVVIFQGEHDWQTPTTLVRPWFDLIESPYKQYVSFEDSGHFIALEEPGKYLFEMINRVRPLAEASRDNDTATEDG